MQQDLTKISYTVCISSYSFRGIFLNLEIVEVRIVAANFNFLPNKLNFCCANYSREETIQGRKLYEEIRYSEKGTKFFIKISILDLTD